MTARVKASHEAPVPVPIPLARFGLIVACLGSLLGPLDSAVNVAMPPITRAFAISIAEIQWIVISFVIAQSSLTVIFGKLGDLYGHRRIFQLGVACCAIAHLLCGFAPTYEALVALRAVQGAAVGLAMACGPALATLLFPPSQKRRVLAIYVMAVSIGIALGPIVGGVMLDVVGWPGVFWFRVPLALLVLVLAIGLPEPIVDRAVRPKLDWLGALLLVVSLTALTLFVSFVRQSDLHPTLVLALLVGGVVAVLLFVRHEARFTEPILHMHHFRNPAFASIQLAAVLVNFCCFANFLLMPYLLADRADYSAMLSGVTLALFPIGSVIAGGAGGWIARHVASPLLMRGGLVLAATGLLCTALVSSGAASIAAIGTSLFITGVGLGLFQVGYLDTTTSILPIAERGVAGSLINVTRLVGLMFGASGITWLYESLRATEHAANAFRLAFGILGAGLLVFSVLFWLVSRARVR